MGSDRVAIVTGGAVRVGQAISLALARSGLRVVVNYRRSEAAAVQLVRRIREQRGTAVAHAADVTDRGAIEGLVTRALSEFGRIDLLVNNAAMFDRQPFMEVDPALWSRTLAVNLEAPLWISQAAARSMLERGSGRIVNICGTPGIHPIGEFVPYCVSKTGLDVLTRCMAQAFAPHIQVNGVAPGAVMFPEATSERERAEVVARIPARRTGVAEDVAAAVLFFANAPDYITGTILPVDGGASLGGA